MPLSNNRRIVFIALSVLLLDQVTKGLVLRRLAYAQEKVVIPGFFKFVHVVNTGAAWSMFTNNNKPLAIVAIVALVLLFLARRHFGVHTLMGRVALGLILGGICGNLVDRLLPTRHHVIDFLYFFHNWPDGNERWGFPAFNIADSAICVGVGLMFLLSWKKDPSITETPEKPRPSEPLV